MSNQKIEECIEALEGMCQQFAYPVSIGGIPCLTTGGLSALEVAFDVLGWKEPYPTPWHKCDKEGCGEHFTCGTPTKNGYKRFCGKHYREYELKQQPDGEKIWREK